MTNVEQMFVLPQKVQLALSQRLTIEDVLAVAEAVPVFPVRIWWDRKNGKLQKAPAISKENGGRGHLDAVRDPEAVKALFARAPGWNAIGVAMGEVCGADVLDTDLQHPSARQWVEQHPLPATPWQDTPSSGRHYFFKHRPGQRSFNGESAGVAKGIDVRGDGGWIVAWWVFNGLDSKLDIDDADWPDVGIPLAGKVRPKVGAAAKGGLSEPKVWLPKELLHTEGNIAWLREMLNAIGAGIKGDPGKFGYDNWLHIGFALHSLGDDFKDTGRELWTEFSRPFGALFDESKLISKWEGFGKEKPEKPITLGTLLLFAKQYGWNYRAPPDDAATVVPPEAEQHLLKWDRTQGGLLKAKSYANTHNGLLQIGLTFQHDIFHDKKLVNGVELSDASCRNYRKQILQRQDVDPGIENIRQAAEQLCEANAFDPVVDYLAEVEPKWDGEPRIDTLLIDYFGAADTPLNRAISRRVLIASARRARKPGTKFDEITVLESPEGFGKSEGLEILYGPENFSDQKILSVSEREIQEKFNGVWCAEIADLTGMKRAQVEDVKALASRVTDRTRPAYGRFLVRQARRTILWGTTNDDEYLKSQTGNRRFLPVKCGKEIDKARLRKERDQIWAEAARYETLGEAITLPRELWAAAQAEQNARLIEDTWLAYLEDLHGTVVGDEERIFTTDVLGRLGLSIEKQTETTGKRVKDCMRRLGWEHKKPLRIGAIVKKGYVRPTGRRPSVMDGVAPQPGGAKNV